MLLPLHCVYHIHIPSKEAIVLEPRLVRVIEQIVREAGYSRFSIAQQNPITLVYEVKI